jgi:hypothetical protein
MLLGLERSFVGAEVDGMPHIFGCADYAGNRRVYPVARILLRFRRCAAVRPGDVAGRAYDLLVAELAGKGLAGKRARPRGRRSNRAGRNTGTCSCRTSFRQPLRLLPTVHYELCIVN